MGQDRWVAAIESSLRLLGVKLPTLNPKSVLPHLLIPMLYTGPLTTQLLSGALTSHRRWSHQDLRRIVCTWKVFRNYVVVSTLITISIEHALTDEQGTHHGRISI